MRIFKTSCFRLLGFSHRFQPIRTALSVAISYATCTKHKTKAKRESCGREFSRGKPKPGISRMSRDYNPPAEPPIRRGYSQPDRPRRTKAGPTAPPRQPEGTVYRKLPPGSANDNILRRRTNISHHNIRRQSTCCRLHAFRNGRIKQLNPQWHRVRPQTSQPPAEVAQLNRNLSAKRVTSPTPSRENSETTTAHNLCSAYPFLRMACSAGLHQLDWPADHGPFWQNFTLTLCHCYGDKAS